MATLKEVYECLEKGGKAYADGDQVRLDGYDYLEWVRTRERVCLTKQWATEDIWTIENPETVYTIYIKTPDVRNSLRELTGAIGDRLYSVYINADGFILNFKEVK